MNISKKYYSELIEQIKESATEMQTIRDKYNDLAKKHNKLCDNYNELLELAHATKQFQKNLQNTTLALLLKDGEIEDYAAVTYDGYLHRIIKNGTSIN